MFPPVADLSNLRILISNDDGINAPGIKVMERIARSISKDVWVVAPEHEQSAAGHSLTIRRPLRVRQLSRRRFAVDGTPTDAVLLGVNHVMTGKRPDLVLSGINRGANLGDDVTYSGTVAAAMEGTLAGIRSIALSQVYAKEGAGDGVSFDAAAKWGKKVLWPILNAPYAPRTLININFPAIPSKKMLGVSGWRVRVFTITHAVPWWKPGIRAAMPTSGLVCTALSTRQGTTVIWRPSRMAMSRLRRCISTSPTRLRSVPCARRLTHESTAA